MDAVKLTKRESEIAELFAWGASKKEVANRLTVSERTVENHARNIYRKTGVTKTNELSAWWFCTNFHISFDLSPIRRKIISMLLLVLVIPQMLVSGNSIVRAFRCRTAKTCRVSRRKSESDEETFGFSV